MYKIAVIGEKESVAGFAVLGLEVFPVERNEEAVDVFKELSKNDEYAILYVTETYEEVLRNRIKACVEQVRPAVILIPGSGADTGIGDSAIDDAVIRAIGAAIV